MAVYPKLLYADNGTKDNVTSSVTVGVADTWCHAALDGYGIIVSDNGSTGGAAGPAITKHFDNGTLSRSQWQEYLLKDLQPTV